MFFSHFAFAIATSSASANPSQVALREHNRRMKMPMQKGLHIASINTAKVPLPLCSLIFSLCGRQLTWRRLQC